MKRVMFIGAHPDDVEINAGGTISMLNRREVETSVVVCTHSIETVRMGESAEALGVLGVNIRNIKALGLEDKNLFSNFVPLVEGIESAVKKHNPDVVVTHFFADTHQDHEAVCKATMAACRFVPTVLMYNPTYPSGRVNTHATPNFVVMLEKVDIDRKILGMTKIVSQKVKYGDDMWLESIRGLAQGDSWRYGGEHGYAELFHVSRMMLK